MKNKKKLLYHIANAQKSIHIGGGTFKDRTLYKTSWDAFFWLRKNHYIDDCITNTGYFEERVSLFTIETVCRDNIVLDIGANIGYFSILMSKLVGPHGKVFAFEPTPEYRGALLKNLKTNSITNVEVSDLALSNKEELLPIFTGDSSATFHWISEQQPRITNFVKTVRLDDLEIVNKVPHIDFIKVDIDGHEYFFLEGAQKTLQKFNPILLLEVSPNFRKANVSYKDFWDILEENYVIYSEFTAEPYKNYEDFAQECVLDKNSANILCIPKIYIQTK